MKLHHRVLALVLAALGGSLAGFVGSIVFKRFDKKVPAVENASTEPAV